jgi:hypothetical protein
MSSIPWIAVNPKANKENLLYQTPMNNDHFEDLCRRLIHETNDSERRLEILFQSKGFFNGEQAGHILTAISIPKDKLKAAMIMEPVLFIFKHFNDLLMKALYLFLFYFFQETYTNDMSTSTKYISTYNNT